MTHKDRAIAVWDHLAEDVSSPFSLAEPVPIDEIMKHRGFVCVEARRRHIGTNVFVCETCPVPWVEGEIDICTPTCEREGSLYAVWLKDKSPANAKPVRDFIKKTWREII